MHSFFFFCWICNFYVLSIRLHTIFLFNKTFHVLLHPSNDINYHSAQIKGSYLTMNTKKSSHKICKWKAFQKINWIFQEWNIFVYYLCSLYKYFTFDEFYSCNPKILYISTIKSALPAKLLSSIIDTIIFCLFCKLVLLNTNVAYISQFDIIHKHNILFMLIIWWNKLSSKKFHTWMICYWSFYSIQIMLRLLCGRHGYDELA